MSEPVYKISAYVPMSAEILRDSVNFNAELARELDYALHPWKRPRVTPWPRIVLWRC